jgi:hypothetical protein
MFKATLAIKPMNNGQMVTTYKNGRKSRTTPIVFGKYGGASATWNDRIIREIRSNNCDIVPCLKRIFTEMGIRGVDMSDFQIDDNKTYYEAICWGEHKNVHFWFEVETVK